MSQPSSAMKNGLAQALPAVLVSVVAALFISRLTQFAPELEALAIVGWIALALWVMHRALLLPAPLSRLIDRLSPARRMERIRAAEREAQRHRLIEYVTAARIEAALDDAIIGQSILNHDVAAALEAFVGKKNPSKPLSVLVAGPPGSGRTSFAEALAAALAPAGAGRLLRVECASDSDIDVAEVGAALAHLPLPILLLDNVDKIGEQRHAGRVIADLLRLVESGLAGGKPLVRRIVVLLTTTIPDGLAAETHQKAAEKADDLPLRMRHSVRTAGHVPAELLDRIDCVEVIKPLGELEQIVIVWKTFCAMAAREHEIDIVDEEIAAADGIEDFLIGAREQWQKAGVSGVREAARYVARVADSSCIAAARAGATRVYARWDRAQGQIQLVPLAPPETAAEPRPAPGGAALPQMRPPMAVGR